MKALYEIHTHYGLRNVGTMTLAGRERERESKEWVLHCDHQNQITEWLRGICDNASPPSFFIHLYKYIIILS